MPPYTITFRQGQRLLSHRGSPVDAFKAFAALWPLHARPTESGNDQYLAHIWTAGGDASGWIPEIADPGHHIVAGEHPEQLLCCSPFCCCGFCDRYDKKRTLWALTPHESGTASAAETRCDSSQPVLLALCESLISVSLIFVQEKTPSCSGGAAGMGYFKVSYMEELLKNVNLRGADVKDYCQGSTDIFTGARPLFSSLFSFDDHLDLNFKVPLEERTLLSCCMMN